MSTLAPHPFWQFSLRTYAKPGVERACLRLQDHQGADVNLALLCCWAAVSGRDALDAQAIDAAVSATRSWQTEIIGPLRRARASLKHGFDGIPGEQRAALRKSIGRAELECEHAEQLLLARQIEALPEVSDLNPAQAAKTSIERYLGILGAHVDQAAQQDIATIVDAAIAL